MRRSKVARLPLRIRQTIARRLKDGYSQLAIVKFLNTQAAVKTALRREQSGRSTLEITSRNLSLWMASAPPDLVGINLR